MSSKNSGKKVSIWSNAQIRLKALTVHVNDAQKPGVSNEAKSIYYRSAIFLSCTILEGMAYQLVKLHTRNNGNIVGIAQEFKKIHKIPKTVLNHPNIVLCRCEDKNVHIDDEGMSFKKLNHFLLSKGIITRPEFEKIDYVRRERNKLHLQSLNFLDIGYTKKKFDKTTVAIDILMSKIDRAYQQLLATQKKP